MPMSEVELRRELAAIEPQYEALLAKLEPGDLPVLREIARGDDLGLSTKAIYLASLLGDEAQEIVVEAAASSVELKRIAAASGMANLREPEAEKVAMRLLDDPNPALAKLVLRSVRAPSPELKAKIQAIEARAQLPEELRTLAREKTRDD